MAAALLAIAFSAPSIIQARGLPTSVTSPLDQDTASALEEAQVDLAAKDYAAAYKVLDRLTKTARFEDNPAQVRRAIWTLMAGCADETRDWPAARAAIGQATAFADAGSDEWYARHLIARHSGDTTEAVRSLAVFARRFPADLERFPDATLLQWRYRAANVPGGDDDAFELTDALVAGWKPQDPFGDLGDLRRLQIEGLLRRGRLEQALASARAIDDPDTLIGMRADKRYDALTLTHPEIFDPKAGNLARLARIDATLKVYPKRLSGQVARAKALLDLDRPDEALAVVDAAIAAARANPDAFEDTDKNLAWAINTQQTALSVLGRGDEALEALEIAARVPENGTANISQTLNLAAAQIRVGRARAALNTAKSVSVSNSSPYGRSVALWIVACASAQLGDMPASDAAIAQLRALGVDGVANLYVALTCRDDLDGAARLLIERLKDPMRRYQALSMLQILPPSPHQPPFDDHRDKLDAMLRARPDVRTAIDAVGRINTYRPEDLWPIPPDKSQVSDRRPDARPRP
jgi:tetratricopeptide (TPR) repeat protein